MAIVTGYSAEKMNEFNNASVVGGSVNTAGSLILKTRGGEEIDAGNVKGPKGETGRITTEQLEPFVQRWKAGTAYAVGQQVVTPLNMVMSCLIAHTAAAQFAADLDRWSGNSVDVPYGHMGRTAGFGNLSSSGLTRVGMDTAQELKGGMTFDNAADALVMPKAGRYLITLKGYFSGPASRSNTVGILINDMDLAGPAQMLATAGTKDDAADIGLKSSGIVSLKKGDKVSVYQSTYAATLWGTNGYNGTGIQILYSGD